MITVIRQKCIVVIVDVETETRWSTAWRAEALAAGSGA
jgi:hypothetical protein